MNDRIAGLIAQMAALERELQAAVQGQESKMFFQISGKPVGFESTVLASHRKLKKSFFRWLITDRPQNLLTGPVIYAMIVSLLMLAFA